MLKNYTLKTARPVEVYVEVPPSGRLPFLNISSGAGVIKV